MATRRLMIEKQEMAKVPPDEGISASPVSADNLAHWQGEVLGPEGTPYQGGHFILEIRFPGDYPFVPPQVLWKTKVYHPNISSSGYICVSILKKENWSPAVTIHSLLISLRSLLSEPNPDDALILSIAKEFTADRETFDRKALKWTSTFASKGREHLCLLN